jgi:DTW domain-containing protein YfiP
MHEDLCVCSLVPNLPTPTRVVLMIHAQEIVKPSNTGRLANLCLPNSEIRLRGTRDGKPLDLENLITEDHETWLLTLSDRSEEITPEMVEKLTKPVRLLVPDGTWSQASRLGSMLARKLPEAKHVMLKATKSSEYRLRSEHLADGMATFEAVARTLGFLEGPQVQEEMEKIFRIMTERTLYVRGKLAAHEVAGGIPRR